MAVKESDGVKRIQPSMTEGPLLGNILRYTFPIIATSLLQLLFNSADLVVVGQFCGSISVAAVGATAAITNLLVNFFIGLSVGVGVAVSQDMGARQDQQVHRTVHTTLPTAIVCGLLLTVLGVAFTEQLLRWMGTPTEVLPMSTVYMKIIFSGSVFSLVYNFLAAILRAAGDTKTPLVSLTLAGILNIILNIVFVTVFEMNVAGVALATILSQALSSVLVTIALIRRTDACRLVLSKIRFYVTPLKRIVFIGLPAAVQSTLFSICNVLVQSSINSFGAEAVSGNAAAMNIDSFIWAAMNAFHQSSTNFTGQNMGAGRYDRIKKILGICTGCGVAAGMVLSIIAFLFGPQLLSIYIPDSPQAIAHGMTRLTYLGLPYFCCAIMDVSTGSLRGMGASITPLIISVLGVCGLRLLWIFALFPLPVFHNLPTLYLSYTASWLLTAVAQLIAFSVIYKKRVKEIAVT